MSLPRRGLAGTLRAGTAGWSIPSACKSSFPEDGSHLSRYARHFDCVEINSSFYKRHQPMTYASWAVQTPTHFRFAAKVPQSITHDARLRRSRALLEAFLGEVAGLEQRLAVLLIQLPPSLPFESRPVGSFFELFRALHAGRIVCEPRHTSWFTPAAERLLQTWHICRVAADPARIPGAGSWGGWSVVAPPDAPDAVYYHRCHGSPRMYWSRYSSACIERMGTYAMTLPDTAERWFIFDNTAGGHAIPNALAFQQRCSAMSTQVLRDE